MIMRRTEMSLIFPISRRFLNSRVHAYDKVPSREHFRAMLQNNKQIRLMHHHVFDEQNSEALLKTGGFNLLQVQVIKPHHIVLLLYRVENNHSSPQW